jgi:alkylated DNA repair dioxygenase AlkB
MADPSNSRERILDLPGGGRVHWAPTFLSKGQADAAFRVVGETTPWKQEWITLFGKRIPQPRLTAWMGDEDAVYTYSGLTLVPVPWTLPVLELKTYVESAIGESFNSVLLNLYRSGEDSMGLHADDEPELGPIVASISLGATRRFVLKFRGRRRGVPSHSLDLGHGSLVVMDAATQASWVHGIPKQSGVRSEGCEARINLTFRRIERRR